MAGKLREESESPRWDELRKKSRAKKIAADFRFLKDLRQIQINVNGKGNELTQINE